MTMDLKWYVLLCLLKVAAVGKSQENAQDDYHEGSTLELSDKLWPELGVYMTKSGTLVRGGQTWTQNLMVTLPDLPPAANVSTHPLLRACDASTKVWLFRSCNDFKDLPVETVEQFQMLRKRTERAHHELRVAMTAPCLKLKGSVSSPK